MHTKKDYLLWHIEELNNQLVNYDVVDAAYEVIKNYFSEDDVINFKFEYKQNEDGVDYQNFLNNIHIETHDYILNFNCDFNKARSLDNFDENFFYEFNNHNKEKITINFIPVVRHTHQSKDEYEFVLPSTEYIEQEEKDLGYSTNKDRKLEFWTFGDGE